MTGVALKIGVCHFGVLRDLPKVLPSIRDHVLAPARALGDVKIFAHLFRQGRIVNPRSGEEGEVDLDQAALLQADQLEWEDPDIFVDPELWSKIEAGGDFWRDDGRSARNLLHQLRSLDRVTEMAVADGCDMVIFARPDLMYHDSLAPGLDAARRASAPTVILPWWQGWGGYNDRFAVAAGHQAIAAYGQRGRRIAAYLQDTGRPFHSERLLRYALKEQDVRVMTKGFRASRVRVDGSVRDEIFERSIVTKLKRELAGLVGMRHLVTGPDGSKGK